MWQLRSTSTVSPGLRSVISIALFDVDVPFVTYRLAAVPNISLVSFWASESGVCASGLERSPRDSTDTERSVRNIVSPNASWKPRRNGEFANARPPLCPGVCQFVPAFSVTYCLSAVEKRGIQKLLKRCTMRSW